MKIVFCLCPYKELHNNHHKIQIMNLIREVLFIILISSRACAQFQTTSNIFQRCTYTFLTESAICGSSNYMSEISREFRQGWKHIRINAYTGTFSLAGIERRKIISKRFFFWNRLRSIIFACFFLFQIQMLVI